jgi:hypothetical protein
MYKHTFLIVLFIAPVTPELQCDPKLMHEIRNTAKSFASNGGGRFLSTELSPPSCEVDETAGSFASSEELMYSIAEK